MPDMRDSKRVSVLKIEEEQQRRLDDDVVMEEPLEIRVNGESFSVTMRTPGDDFDLAFGLLWSEGIIGSPGEIGTIAYCPDEEQPELKNIVNVVLTDSGRKLESSRRLWSNSSCGLCGKATLDAIHQVCRPITSTISVSRELLYSLPARLRQAQPNFERTGGIHAVGLFDAQGGLLVLREDIGRHNAVDKVLGAALAGSFRIRDRPEGAGGGRSDRGVDLRAVESCSGACVGFRDDHDRFSPRPFDERVFSPGADQSVAAARAFRVPE